MQGDKGLPGIVGVKGSKGLRVSIECQYNYNNMNTVESLCARVLLIHVRVNLDITESKATWVFEEIR